MNDLPFEIIEDMPFIVFVKDEARKFVFVNRAFREFFGREDCLGRLDEALDQTELSVARWRKIDKQLFARGGRHELPIDSVLDKDGSPANLRTTKFLIRPRNGKRLLVGISEPLRRGSLSNLLSALIGDSSDGAFIKDLEGRYVFVNEKAAQILGYQCPADIEGRLTSEINHPNEAASRELDRQVVETKVAQTVRRHIWLNGELVTSHTTKTPIFDSDGEVVGLHAKISDITDLNKVARSVAWNEFAARTAHRIKGHLGILECRLQRVLGESESCSVRESVRNELSAIRSLVETAVKPVEPHEKLYSVFEISRVIQSGIELTQKAPGTLIYNISGAKNARVIGDRSSLTECFIELTNNAYYVAAGPYGDGRCELDIQLSIVEEAQRMEEPEEYVKILFKDNGMGVPEPEKETIFRRDVSTKADGWGVGLYDIRNAFEAHRGRIREIGDRSGACFEILLPLVTSE